jgi:hypothetical protein
VKLSFFFKYFQFLSPAPNLDSPVGESVSERMKKKIAQTHLLKTQQKQEML